MTERSTAGVSVTEGAPASHALRAARMAAPSPSGGVRHPGRDQSTTPASRTQSMYFWASSSMLSTQMLR